jgi:hypothetical protein
MAEVTFASSYYLKSSNMQQWDSQGQGKLCGKILLGVDTYTRQMEMRNFETGLYGIYIGTGALWQVFGVEIGVSGLFLSLHTKYMMEANVGVGFNASIRREIHRTMDGVVPSHLCR